MVNSAASKIACDGVDRLFAGLSGLPVSAAWGAVLGAFAAISVADYFAGPAFSFSTLYILDVVIAAWTIGGWYAFVLGVAAIATNICLNGFQLPATGYLAPIHSTANVWNLSMRLLALGMTLTLVTGFRRAFVAARFEAERDPLTGLLNRRGLNASFRKTVARAARAGTLLVVAYADLDRFKQLNDRLGHDAGDTLLKIFGGAIDGALRGCDTASRLGGDEFLILLEARSVAEGEAAVSRIHRRLSDVLGGPWASVTCSMGAVIADPRMGLEIEDALKQADQLLYDCKRSNRAGIRIKSVAPLPAARPALAA
jgi:diguanylate cyclase (GGDEF)-like protein